MRRAIVMASVSLLATLMSTASAQGIEWSIPWKKIETKTVPKTPKPSLATKAKNTSKDAWRSTKDFITLKPVRDRLGKKPQGLSASSHFAANDVNDSFWRRMWPGKKSSPKKSSNYLLGSNASSNSMWGNVNSGAKKVARGMNPLNWFKREPAPDDGARTVQEFLAQPRPGESYWR